MADEIDALLERVRAGELTLEEAGWHEEHPGFWVRGGPEVWGGPLDGDPGRRLS